MNKEEISIPDSNVRYKRLTGSASAVGPLSRESESELTSCKGKQTKISGILEWSKSGYTDLSCKVGSKPPVINEF